MGIEHMTFQTLVRCSNHSANGNYSDKQVNIILGWQNDVKWTRESVTYISLSNKLIMI